MKESLDYSFARYIEKNAEALRAMADDNTSNLGMFWVVLVYIFDFNSLYIYERVQEGFRKSAEFTRDSIGDELRYENFAWLMEAAFAENKAKTSQKEEALTDQALYVEAIAAIPLVIDNEKKVLVLCKQLVQSKDEAMESYVFDSYQLELYSSVIRIFIRIHELERQQKKALEALVLQSQKLAEVGNLTAGVAHEINNPLSTIITKLEMLQEYVRDFKEFLLEFKHDNRLILSQTKRLKADFIIDRLEKSIQLPLEMAERVRATVLSLKRYAATDRGEMDLVNVNQLLDASLEIVGHKVKHKAVITKDYTQNLKPIKTSSNRLSQVLVNILDNAADAITDHGSIRINTWQDEKETSIQIIDDGVGISNENLKRLFTPYFTTKEDGLGIGLYLNHLIISGLKGTITVESELGKGATFTVRLPLV